MNNKMFRYWGRKLFLVLLLMTTVSVKAQDNERALAAAVEDIVLSNDLNMTVVNEFVEEIYKKHCKSAYLATRIAKAFYRYSVDPETKLRNFGRHEPDTAFVYINRAIALDPKYPDSYILASDILKYEKGQEGRKEAMEWLDRGIAANPTEPSLYVASAQILALTDSTAAVAKLNDLKRNNPDFPVEMELGRLYWNLYNDVGGSMPFAEMAAAYDKANKDDMTIGDLEAYSFALYGTNQIEKMYEVSSYGVAKYPESFMLNMNVFYGLLGLKKYKEAVAAGEKFLNSVDKSKLEPLHYLRYGEALVGDKQYEKALEQYDFVLNMEKATDNQKDIANSHIESAIGEKVNDLIKLGDYDQAVATYSSFIKERKNKGKLEASMLSMYARIYMSQAEEQNGDEKEATFLKADKIYTEMQETFPKFEDIAIYNRMLWRTIIDPGPDYPKGGIAKPFAEKLATLLSAKDPLTSGQEERLVYAYFFLSYYYAVKGNNRALAISYAEKVLEIRPDHSGATNVLKAFKKR